MEMLKLMSFKRLYWPPSQMRIVSFNLSNDYPDWLPSKVNCTLYGIGWQSCTSLHDVDGWAAISSGGNCKMPNDDAVWEHEFARERVILFFFQPYSKLLYTVLRTVFHDDIYLDPFCDPMLSIPLAYGWTHMNYSQIPTLGWNETLFSVRHFGPHATSHPCITQKRQWVAASVSISPTSHSPTCLCKSCPA